MDIGKVIEIGKVVPQEIPNTPLPERVPERVPEAEPVPELVPA